MMDIAQIVKNSEVYNGLCYAFRKSMNIVISIIVNK